MRLIILAFLVLSTLIFSGCHFSLWDAGVVHKKAKQTIKIGLIASDLMTENSLNEFIEYEERMKREEDLKNEGVVFGIFFQRRF